MAKQLRSVSLKYKRPSFRAGFVSSFDVWGQNSSIDYKLTFSFDNDRNAIRNDWENILSEIREARIKFKNDNTNNLKD